MSSNADITRVKDVMNHAVTLVSGKDLLDDALRKMSSCYSRVLVVDKRHDDDEYGIVCLADIAVNVIAENKSPERINVYEVMSKPALTVSEDMDVRYCIRLFQHFKLHRAPVIDSQGLVVGIIGYDDMIFKGLLPQTEKQSETL